jgi:hypothetical protein
LDFTKGADERDFTGVIGLEPGPVADADDGRGCEFVVEEVHDAGLAEFVERRGRLVHDDKVGWIDENARKGDALLFAARKNAAPVLLIVELPDQMGETAFF